jgi:putative cell wall-binding protein/CubicO group peptidase (beta-lactamase class C family)
VANPFCMTGPHPARRPARRPAAVLLALVAGCSLLAPPAAAVAGGPPAVDRVHADPGAAPWERVPRDRVAEECGQDPDLMDQAEQLLTPRPFTVVRYGKLCWEARATDEQYSVASITKTFGALLFGVAASRSSLSDEDPVTRWIADGEFPLINREARLAHVLAMTATRPLLGYGQKGPWVYDIDGSREINVLIDVIDRVIAEEPEHFPGIADAAELAQEALFDPLGMTSSSWAGTSIGASLQSTPQDLARLGLLWMRDGLWDGERIIDPEYLHRMTHPSFEDANTGYGYLTYINADLGWFYSTGTNDLVCSPVGVWDRYPHRPFLEAPDDNGGSATRTDMVYDVGVNWASGAGGQRITTHPALDLVMTIRDESTNEGHKRVWDAIRPALVALDPVYQGDVDAFCADYRESRYAPDLLPALAVATPTVQAGDDAVTFSAVVANTGEQHATEVPVRFAVDGAAIGDVVAAEVPLGGAATVTSPPWTGPATGGAHTVTVTVDPDGSVAQAGPDRPTASTSFVLSDGPGRLLERHAGAGRVETAVAVSGRAREAAETVVIARADDPSDALAGAPLAAALEAPLLLSDRDGLSAATAAEIRRLGATAAVLLGGESALSGQLVADLRHVDVGVHEVRRLAGANRYATAAAIAGELDGAEQVLVVRADPGAFADAISASGVAASLGAPILLTPPDLLPPETAEVIGPDADVVIVGGPAAVGEAVETSLRTVAADVRRVAGPDRYATSAALAEDALSVGLATDVVWVATGAAFPDGLVAGPAAARDGARLLLVDGTDLDRSAATRDLLRAAPPRVVRLAGGTSAVGDDVAGALVGAEP